MTWIHWLLLASLVVGWGFLLADWLGPDTERFEDVDELAKASRSDGETTGAGSSPCPPSIPRPGPIRGPLSNGRRNR
jgi:hypothetical protein